MSSFEKAGRKQSKWKDMHCVFLYINTNADLNGSPCTPLHSKKWEATWSIWLHAGKTFRSDAYWLIGFTQKPFKIDNKIKNNQFLIEHKVLASSLKIG